MEPYFRKNMYVSKWQESLFNFFFFFVMSAYLKDIFSRESQFVIKLNKYKTVKVRKDYTHDVVSFELTC